MNIIYYHPLFNAQEWLAGIKQRLPQAEIREWQRGDERPADYALVWRPPHEMLANRRDLKAVFALGAGVDAILDQERNPRYTFAYTHFPGVLLQPLRHLTVLLSITLCAVDGR